MHRTPFPQPHKRLSQPTRAAGLFPWIPMPLLPRRRQSKRQLQRLFPAAGLSLWIPIIKRTPGLPRLPESHRPRLDQNAESSSAARIVAEARPASAKATVAEFAPSACLRADSRQAGLGSIGYSFTNSYRVATNLSPSTFPDTMAFFATSQRPASWASVSTPVTR